MLVFIRKMPRPFTFRTSCSSKHVITNNKNWF
ncbi:unnamed protein product [Schistosoma mattheei]|uniref:Uncharacterized protein n=1 Tax=Schistosoma mattheei TaxID=31246 RepID=A0A183PSX6_9TREM|nr:unnamed protein product [Schistosoma mattheei]